MRNLLTNESFINFSYGSWWIYFGGLIGVVYIALAAISVQHLGVLNFTLFSVSGMLFSSLVIDFYFPINGTTVAWYLYMRVIMAYIGALINKTVN